MPDKHYVNLANELPVKVKRAGVMHVRARKLDWEVEIPAPHADACEVLPRIKNGTEVGNPQKKRTTESAVARTFENAVVLPAQAGLEFTVKVKKSAGENQGTDNVNVARAFQTWNKLYYTVNYVSEAARDLFVSCLPDIKTILGRAHLELDEVAVLPQRPSVGTADEPTVRPSRVDSDVEYTFPAKHNGKTDRAPNRHLRVLMVNDVVTDAFGNISDQYRIGAPSKLEFDEAAKTLTFHTPSKQTWVMRNYRASTLVFEGKNYQDLEEHSVAAEVGDDKTIDVTLKLDNPTLQPVFNKFKEWKDAGRGSGYNLRLEYRYHKSLGGYYTPGTNTIVVTSIRAPTDALVNQQERLIFAFCHELAHSIGLVPENERIKQGAAWISRKNAKRYERKGGSGSHCSTECTEVEGIMTPNADARVCIMHHNIVPAQMEDFCPDCQRYLKNNEVRLAV